jgi:DNA-binding response OmpR family regulator
VKEVLCVDKNPVLYESYKHFLERDNDIHVTTALSADEALERMKTIAVDAIIADYDLPGTDGIQFLRMVREKFPGILFIIVTGSGSEEIVIEALNNGADYYIRKGTNPESRFLELSDTIRSKIRAKDATMLARKNLTMFSGLTRHDILNQLMIISGSLELAADDVKEPALLQNLARAQTATATIQRQITFSREYENLGAGVPLWQPLKTVIRQAFLELQSDTLTLELPKDAIEVFADPILDKVFFHLFTYTEKYGNAVTRITVSYGQTAHGLIIFVSDNGVGISPADRHLLFDKKPGKERLPGPFLAERILEVTGMSIRETGDEKDGMLFEIVVPYEVFRQGKNSPHENPLPGKDDNI